MFILSDVLNSKQIKASRNHLHVCCFSFIATIESIFAFQSFEFVLIHLITKEKSVQIF